MSTLILLGAGFSRNWGGWLANEAFEYLLGCPEILADRTASEMLWQFKDSGGFESALGNMQQEWKRDPQRWLPHLLALQDAIRRMFGDMNAAFLAKSDFEFQHAQAHTQPLRNALLRFDAVFTLNQDLLLEYRYLFENVAPNTAGRWEGFQIPGLARFARGGNDATPEVYWVPRTPAEFKVAPKMQPYFKLHGSSNWNDPSGGPLLVMGGNKASEIRFHPILSWYYQLFEQYMREANSRLLVIGYGFGDEHINAAIAGAVEKSNLKLFIIDPQGADLPWKSNQSRTKGSIAVPTSLEEMFRRSVIGASRRSLGEIFGGDSVEYTKVMRFIAS